MSDPFALGPVTATVVVDGPVNPAQLTALCGPVRVRTEAGWADDSPKIVEAAHVDQCTLETLVASVTFDPCHGMTDAEKAVHSAKTTALAVIAGTGSWTDIEAQTLVAQLVIFAMSNRSEAWDHCAKGSCS